MESLRLKKLAGKCYQLTLTFDHVVIFSDLVFANNNRIALDIAFRLAYGFNLSKPSVIII